MTDRQNAVAVEQEIELIRSLIEIHQLRIAEEDEVIISLNVSGDIETIPE